MSIATQWPSEKITYADPVTGVEMTRLTCYKGNHNHLYFTNPGWYDGNKRLVICGDRDNRSNLFSICLQTGAISQLTDLPEFPLPYEHVLQRPGFSGGGFENPSNPQTVGDAQGLFETCAQLQPGRGLSVYFDL